MKIAVCDWLRLGRTWGRKVTVVLITRYCSRMDGSVDKQRVMWDSSWVSEGEGCGQGVRGGVTTTVQSVDNIFK